GAFPVPDFCLIFAPLKGYDEPEILRSQLSRFGPISADAGQISTLGQFPPKEDALPTEGRPPSKPRKTSSNSLFTSRCSDRNGSRSLSRNRLGTRFSSRPHGIRSRTLIVILLSSVLITVFQ